jgi:uncharacterized protein
MFEKVFSRPRVIVLATVLITLFAIPFMLKVKIHNSIESAAIKTDPAFYLIKFIQDNFYSNEEGLSLAIQTQDSIFTEANLQYLNKLTADLENIPKIQNVISLTNLQNIKVTDEEIKVEPLISQSGLSKQEIEEIVKHPLYRKLFISKDRKSTFVAVTFEPLGKDSLLRRQIIDGITAVIKKHNQPGIQVDYTGMPFLEDKTNHIIEDDNLTILPAALAIIALFLYLIYRRKPFVALPFLITIIAIMWTISLIGMVDRHINQFTSLVPLVLLTICLCDSVHILNSIWKVAVENKKQLSQKQLIINGVKTVALPCLLTSVTTMVGFFSLVTSDMTSAKEMGILIGMGVFFAFILSILILPVALFKIDLRKKQHITDKSFIFFSRIMRRLGETVLGRPKLFLLVGLALSLTAIFGVTRLKIGQHGWNMYKKPTVLEKTNTLFHEQEFGAGHEGNLVFRAKPGTFKNPKTLMAMQRISREIENFVLQCSDYGLTKFYGRELEPTQYTPMAFSIADMYSFVSGKDLNANPPIELTTAEISSAQTILNLSTDTFFASERYINEDASLFRIQLFSLFGESSSGANELDKTTQQLVYKYLPKDIEFLGIADRAFVWSHVVDYLARSQIRSFGVAFILISLMMGLLFRSVKIGFLSMIPNTVPVLMMLGTLGWLGVPLNSFTAMVSCIALGLAVDDTVHYISHFRQKSLQGLSTKDALLSSFENVGFPMLITSLLLAIGFLAFYFSKLSITTEFGFLISYTCVLALLADLFLLPPILLLTKTEFGKKARLLKKDAA